MDEEAVSAAEANRCFSRLLRAVRGGRRFLITSHGRPAARMVPVSEGDDHVGAVARRLLLDRLAAEPVVDVGRWQRDDLYERLR